MRELFVHIVANEAFMELVTSNTQGELAALEHVKHAYESHEQRSSRRSASNWSTSPPRCT